MATTNNNTAPSQGNSSNNILVILVIAVIAILAVGAIYMMQDNRSGTERAADAVEALPQGVDRAAGELGDQPPAENVQRNAERAAQ